MKIILTLVFISTIIISGCKETPVEQTPIVPNPIVNSGWTDIQGKTTFDLGNYQIQATINDSASQYPINKAYVQAFLLDNLIVVFANDTTNGHYLGFKTYNTSSFSKLESEKDAPIPIVVILGLAAVTYIAYEFIEGTDIIFNNGWVEKICYHPDYADLFSLIVSTVAPLAIKTGIVIKLGPVAATKLGVAQKTIKISSEALRHSSGILLAELARLFNFMNEDRARICFYIPKNLSDFKLPLLQIEDVELRRNIENKITLTWGLNPSDIDAHLWTPTINGTSHHIYYNNKGSLTSLPYASLDVDDVTSYGPENLTIKTLYPGTYKIAIHHYAGTGTITTSEASVINWSRTFTPVILNVPTGNSGNNWWWYIGDIDGTTKAFTLRNQISANPPGPVDDNIISK